MDPLHRLKEKAGVLEDLVTTIKESIMKKNKERESWFQWHIEWKKAWLSKNPEDPLIKEKRESTSVTRRMPAI